MANILDSLRPTPRYAKASTLAIIGFAVVIYLNGCAGAGSLRLTAAGERVRLPETEFGRLAGTINAVTLYIDDYPDQILLIKSSEGDYRAFSARCPHQGCQVRPGAKFLVCPCHGSTFDRDGVVMRGPAAASLPSYPVQLDQGEIVIQLPAGGAR